MDFGDRMPETLISDPDACMVACRLLCSSSCMPAEIGHGVMIGIGLARMTTVLRGEQLRNRSFLGHVGYLPRTTVLEVRHYSRSVLPSACEWFIQVIETINRASNRLKGDEYSLRGTVELPLCYVRCSVYCDEFTA